MPLARSKYGIHIANRGEPFLDLALSVGFDIFFGLHTNLDWLLYLQHKRPDALVVARWYDRDICARDPGALAREMVDWCYATGIFHVTPGNELNLVCEHGGAPGSGPKGQWDSYADYAAVESWLLAVVREGKRYDHLGRVFWWRPAESPGHSEDSPDHGFVAWESFPGSLREYDGVTMHSYWPNPDEYGSEWFGQRWERKLRLLAQLGLDKPVLITETNRPWDHGSQEDGEQYATELIDLYARTYDHPAVVGVCPFIFATDDADFAAMTFVQQSGAEQPVVSRLRSVIKLPTEVLDPVLPDSDDYVRRYGEGFARVLRERPELVGGPLQTGVQIATQQEVPSGEDAYVFSHLRTARGRLFWEKASNRMVFIDYSGKVMEV
jgi:hypothetical protein